MNASMKSPLSRRTFIRTASAAAAAGTTVAGSAHSANNGPAQRERVCGWFKNVKRMLHIDSHFAEIADPFKDFDAEKAAKMYADAGIQLVSFFAKCAGGYSYYPTKIGLVHPTLKADYTGELAAALKKRGIRSLLYFYTAVERRTQKEHPEWVVNSDPGKIIAEGAANMEAATMCFNSPYVERIAIPQMKEIIEKYDFDGFFFDIVVQQYLSANCHCQSCRDLFKQEVGGEIPVSDTDPNAFAYRKWSNRRMEAHMETVYRALAAMKPDIAIINNYAWMAPYPVTPSFFVPHVTWDTASPLYGNYSWNFSMESRYLNTLPDVPFSCMNTRGNTWGDYTLREPEAFQHECAILLAACGGNYLSDCAYASGNPDPAVYEVYKKVNDRYKALEPLLEGSRPVREIAVLHSADSVWSKTPLKPHPQWTFSPAYYSVTGAHKALVDLHRQVGIFNSTVCADTVKDYRALVLSDQRILGEPEITAIHAFVKNGGALVVTRDTGTRDAENRELSDFALADVLGIRYRGAVDVMNCFFRVLPEMKRFGMPMMDVQVGGGYARIETVTAKKLLDLVPPYRGLRSGPPDTAPGVPGITINTYGKGKAIYCAADLFGSFFENATPNLRKIAAWMLDAVYPAESALATLENAPTSVELFFNERGQERFVHLVGWSGDKRDIGTPQVQNFPAINDIRVRVRAEKRPKEITLLPDGGKVDFTWANGVAVFTARPLRIHDVYRITL